MHVAVDVSKVQDRLKHHRHGDTGRDEEQERHHHCDQLRVLEKVLSEHRETEHSHAEQHQASEELHDHAKAVSAGVRQPDEEADKECRQDHPERTLDDKAERVDPRFKTHDLQGLLHAGLPVLDHLIGNVVGGLLENDRAAE